MTLTTEARDLMNEMLALYSTIASDARNYLAREASDKAAGIIAMVAHQWVVCLNEPGYNMAVEVAGNTARLKGVAGNLIGTSQYTREGAAKVIAFWKKNAPESTRDVVAVRNIDLVRARLAEAERQIEFIKTRVAEVHSESDARE